MRHLRVRHGNSDCWHGKHGACHNGWNPVRNTMPELYPHNPVAARRHHAKMAGYYLRVVAGWKEEVKRTSFGTPEHIGALLMACQYEASRIKHLRRYDELKEEGN